MVKTKYWDVGPPVGKGPATFRLPEDFQRAQKISADDRELPMGENFDQGLGFTASHLQVAHRLIAGAKRICLVYETEPFSPSSKKG